MEPLFLGSHPAIDFLNTAFEPDGNRIETLGDGRAFIGWLVGVGLLDEGSAARFSRRFRVEGLDAAAAEARKLREWARAWLTEWRVSPDADYSTQIARLNRLLLRETFHRELVSTEEGMKLVERPVTGSADALLAPIALSIAELIAHEDPSLVRSCAGNGCTLWFLDRTKGHRRRYCSQSVCGNRAKVAAFRERQNRS